MNWHSSVLKYESATDPVNTTDQKIDKIVKSYDKSGMVIGEAPLMKDLQDVTDVDLVNVNIIRSQLYL